MRDPRLRLSLALLVAGALWLLAQWALASYLQRRGWVGAQVIVFGCGIVLDLFGFWLFHRWPHLRPAIHAPGGAAPMEVAPVEARYTVKIRRIFERANLNVEARIQRGPFVLSYTIRPRGDMLAGLRALRDPSLRQAMAMATATTVRVVPGTAGVVFELELPREAHTTPSAGKLARVAEWGRIPVGVDQQMRPVFLNPAEHGSCFWIAPPRRGKTANMRSTLFLMRRAEADLRFVIIGLASKLAGDWLAFAGVDGCLGLVSDAREIEQCLRWAAGEMAAGITGPLVIVIDDMTNISGLAPEVDTHVDALATAGAGLGYHLLIGTHSAGSKRATGGKLVQSTMTAKILFKASDNATAARSSGRGNAETGIQQLSGYPGDALFDDGRQIMRIATARVSDEEILALPQLAGPLSRPWLKITDHDHGHGQAEQSQPRTRNVGSASTPRRAGISDRDRRKRALDALPAGMFPIVPARPLNDAEARQTRALFTAAPFSPSGLADLVFDGRNPTRVGYVRQALAPLDLADEEKALYEELAILILEQGDAHPRRYEALQFLAAADQIFSTGGK